MDRENLLKISLITLGCKTNQTDAASLAAEFAARGHEIISSPKEADTFIVHTCTVTQKSDYQARQAIRRAILQNPEAKVIVTGCYAQIAPDILKEIPGVDFVVGMGKRNEIPDLLQSREKQKKAQVLSSDVGSISSFDSERPPLFLERSRAYLKVQDGCNSFCSYCIVPFARGRNRSLPLERARAQVLELGSAGFKEIILTGIHLGTYGEDFHPPCSLLDLLQILEKERGISRIRLSSIEPGELDLPLIQFLSQAQNICPHLHIPLQSGDDGILRRMNRTYSPAYFEDQVHRLVSAIPDLAIGVDLIGGFPGEDDQAFENTYNLVFRLPLAYLHVFPFSRRQGTPAAKFPDPVPAGVIKARCQSLRDLGIQKRNDFYRSFLGRRVRVLIEGKRDRVTGLLRGFSRNYIPVLIDGGEEWIHQEVEVPITEVQDGKVFGKII